MVLPINRPRGATWVTREHVFVDRVACPWLIRRFIDPDAKFEFVPWNTDVTSLEAKGMIPFDMESGKYTHRDAPTGELCSFEVLVQEFGLADDAALQIVARVVHGADVEADLDKIPEARGLKAISWGWRFNYAEDHEAIREGAKLYEALYTWARVRIVQERDAVKLKAMSSLERYHYLRAHVEAT